MPEIARRFQRRETRQEEPPPVFPLGGPPLGWLLKNRFVVLHEFLDEDLHGAHVSRSRAEARFENAIDVSKKWMLAKAIVTALLMIGVITAVAGVVLNSVPALSAYADPIRAVLNVVAAIAGSLSAVLLVARLVIERALVRLDFATLHLGARLARHPTP